LQIAALIKYGSIDPRGKREEKDKRIERQGREKEDNVETNAQEGDENEGVKRKTERETRHAIRTPAGLQIPSALSALSAIARFDRVASAAEDKSRTRPA